MKVGFVGAGAMAEAMIGGLLASGELPPDHIFASDISPARLDFIRDTYGVNVCASNSAAVEHSQVVVVAVKPQVVPEIIPDLRGALKGHHMVISIAAGVTLEFLESELPPGTPVIRAMPNNPCLIRQGASVMAPGRWAGPEHEELAERVLRAVGLVTKLPEHLLDAVTALSGSGPAYVYLFIEALIDAGVLVGLPREVARTLVLQTVLGAVGMVQSTGRHPAELRDMVTSPAGTTVAGLAVMEQAGLRGVLMNAVKAAWARSRELGRKT